MRLTLRTLLAWMDDTLSAAEVREIGKQLGESPNARELAERINRVARQRRLTVPGDTLPDGVDPNIVARYLDNELSAEGVAAYEKLCLTSDVHLAEVASIHQILSLIGQKAKVPPEARHRMYRLVRGREASRNRSARDFAPSHDEIATPVEVKRPATPVARWGTESGAEKKSFIERFGLAGAVIGLMAVLVFAAFNSLQGDDPVRVKTDVQLAQIGGPQAGQPVAVAPTTDPNLANRLAAEKEAEAAKKKVEDEAKAASEPKPADPAPANASAPALASAKVEKTEGIALLGSSAQGPWKPIQADGEIKPGEFLINLTPAWTSLKLDGSTVILQGVGEVGLIAGEKGKPSRLQMEQGRLVIRDLERSKPFLVEYRGKTLTISGTTAASVGLDVRPASLAGTADVAPPSLQILIPDGEATIQWGEASAKLSGASSLSILPTDEVGEKSRGPVPNWVTDTAPSAFDSQLAERFAKSIRAGRPIDASLVEAGADDDKDIRRLSIAALAGLGNSGMIVPILNETSDSRTRKAAVDAIRYLLVRDPASRKAVRSELEKTFGPGAEVTEKLLVGYTPEEMKEETTVAGLVPLLSAPDLGTRALAIEALKSITGRDSMEYDPTMPEGKGLSNWRDLLLKKEPRKAVGGERVPPPPQPKSR